MSARRPDELPAARLAGLRQQHDPLRLLVCEPDPTVLAALRGALAALNVELLVCADGAQALFQAGRQHPDIVLLAPVMPVLGTADVVRAIVDGGGDPVIVVGHADDSDEVTAAALAAGADRVLARPYAAADLRDVCLKLIDRLELDNPIVQAGALSVHPLAYEVHLDGRRIPMPVRELEVLLYLIRHQDRIVSVAELQEALWTRDDLGPRSNAVAAAVLRLRGRLTDDRRPDIIRTVRRRGYRFYAPEPASAATGAG